MGAGGRRRSPVEVIASLPHIAFPLLISLSDMPKPTGGSPWAWFHTGDRSCFSSAERSA